MLTAKKISELREKPAREGKGGERGDEVLGSKLRALRQQHDLSQEEVVEASGGLFVRSGLSHIESGRQNVMARQLVWFARFYEISVDSLCDHLYPVESD
ncbi:helix-turn-helix domain-containing protein [Deinococcus peraridilitoris]|uniref:Helix-turn-helix protein n=1 Tax=Deinococcus peraridilitoris (strain DSM 19664 / LMG 22246 / CIP 109416 / KR-200) TaxID=937777 RepID=K9ZZD5_DEIPD|nr:helix-turn-helix transcriptional regulator [Deinococcus peraridilitoris]AFZ67008.1 Helix-turn-helix protein [Deinococcus peraridilitoris DSM 19664]